MRKGAKVERRTSRQRRATMRVPRTSFLPTTSRIARPRALEKFPTAVSNDQGRHIIIIHAGDERRTRFFRQVVSFPPAQISLALKDSYAAIILRELSEHRCGFIRRAVVQDHELEIFQCLIENALNTFPKYGNPLCTASRR